MLFDSNDDLHTPIAITVNGKRRDVEAVSESWEIDDEWWRDPIARRYFDLVLAGGKRIVVFEDRLTGQWYEQQ